MKRIGQSIPPAIPRASVGQTEATQATQADTALQPKDAPDTVGLLGQTALSSNLAGEGPTGQAQAGGLSRSIALMQKPMLATMTSQQLHGLANDVKQAIKGIGVDEDALFASLAKLHPQDAAAFRAVYQQRFGESVSGDVGSEWFLSSAEHTRAKAYIDGNAALGDAIGLHQAFDAGDASAAFALLEGGTFEGQEALKTAYREHFGRDLEYQMRGWSMDNTPLDLRGFTPTLRGLKGADLTKAFQLLHTPRLQRNAARIAALTENSPASTPAGRKEIYQMLSLAGGEERTLLAALYQQETGKDLVETLRPVMDAHSSQDAPLTTDPKKTVAIVVSSGNWKKVASGESDQHIGGYHWREIEAYVAEALERGYTPVIFTPDGLPPSPDAASLLQGKFGPQVGFGLRAGTGPDSTQGKAIMEGFAAPRSLTHFDPSQFATIHVAGGHGSHHDLIGNPTVEAAATLMHERGQVVTGVCHASPALGKLLEGGPATSFSPQIDDIMLKAGYILPEFDPPYDAHTGLVDLGVDFTLIDRAQSFVNIHHTERYDRPGRPPVITGTGPEATDNVARLAFDWLAQQ